MRPDAILGDLEKNFIRANCHRLTDKDIARILSRLNGTPVSTRDVRRARDRLKIGKTPQGCQTWVVTSRPDVGDGIGLTITGA